MGMPNSMIMVGGGVLQRSISIRQHISIQFTCLVYLYAKCQFAIKGFKPSKLLIATISCKKLTRTAVHSVLDPL